MTEKKGKEKPTQQAAPVLTWKADATPVPLAKFVEETADTHKTIIYGESNVGKTRWWMLIAKKIKALGLPPEKVKMCVIYPDRRTGLTKLAGLIPPEYYNHGCVDVFPVSNYEQLISATATAEKILDEHLAKTGIHGWMIHELLGEPWVFSQDYYTRKSYGEGLGDYFATKKQLDKAVREDASAYRALDGWKDWSVIKLFHNFGWADKIKRMSFNILFTAEIKSEEREDSIFCETGKPAGEKENIHRVDEILLLTRVGNEFFMQPLKLTGFTQVYPKQNITGKNGFARHLEMLDKLDNAGYKEAPIQTLEKKAGIKPPSKPTQKKEESPKEKPAEKKEAPKKEEATSKTISGSKGKKETEKPITTKELSEPPKKPKEEASTEDIGDDW